MYNIGLCLLVHAAFVAPGRLRILATIPAPVHGSVGRLSGGRAVLQQDSTASQPNEPEAATTDSAW